MSRTALLALVAVLVTACGRDLVDVADPDVPMTPTMTSAATLADSYGNLILSHQPEGYWRFREAQLYGLSSINGEQLIDVSGHGRHGIYRSLPSDHVVSGIFHGDSLGFVAGNPMLNFPGGREENFGYFSNGPEGTVVDPDGARIEIPHDSSLSLLDNFSFEIWIRPRPASDSRYNLVAINSEHEFNRFGNSDFGYFLLEYWHYPRGELPNYVNKGDISWSVASYHWSGWSTTSVYGYPFKGASVDPESGAETHLVGVHENNVVRLYVNGRLVAAEDISGESGLTGADGQQTTGSGFRQDLTDISNPPNAAKPLMIGGARYIEGGADYVGFAGSMGESAFYRRALSTAEVYEHYAAGIPRVCGDDRDVIINEYYKYEVNLDPGCENFAEDGGSVHFTWSELNGGWADGNPHATWGMVTVALTVGLEATRLNYGGPIRLSSGYRCPHGNTAIGSSAPKTSFHMHGRAADMYSADREWTEEEFGRL